MAITLDSTATSITTGFNAGPTTKTWTHTINGLNSLLVLSGDIWQDTGGVGTITSATFAGRPFIKIDQQRIASMSAELWYMPSPPMGEHTVSVTITGAYDAIKFATSSFFGVSQSSPLDTSVSATGSSGNPTLNLTTGADNALVVSTLSRFSVTDAVPSGSQIVLYDDHAVSTLAQAMYIVAGAAGSQTMGYTGTSANDWTELAASFKPAAPSNSPVDEKASTFSVGDGMSRSEAAN